MTVQKNESLALQSEDDIVRVRQVVRQWALQLGFSIVEQTKIVTAASELARNTVTHGGGGQAVVEVLKENQRVGLRMIFVDHGPGIHDLELAMKDGYTSNKGMGLGLGAAKRLVNEFTIDSRPNEGTRVAITKWK